MQVESDANQSRDYHALMIATTLLCSVAVVLPLWIGAPTLAASGAVFTLTLILLIRLDQGRGAIARVGVHLTLPAGLGFIVLACYGVGISNVIAVHFSVLMILMTSYTVGARAAIVWSIPCIALIVFTVLSPPAIVRDVGPVATIMTRVSTALAVLAISVSFRMHQDRQARELSHEALTDSLTGLANRRQMERVLAGAVDRAERFDRRCAVVFADLDGLKRINDELGHEAGDRLISAVADRIQTYTRRIDTVARLGGDEFVIVLSEINDEASVERFTQSLLQHVCSPLDLPSRTLTPSISVGVACYPGLADSAQSLLARADAAMYSAKQAGGGCVVVDGAA